MNAGSVVSIASVDGPNGTGSIYNGSSWASGWSSSISGNNITITKPIAKRALNAQTHGTNGANTFSRSIIAVTTSTFSCVQPASLASVTFNAITSTNTGCASSGTTTVDITFQLEA